MKKHAGIVDSLNCCSYGSQEGNVRGVAQCCFDGPCERPPARRDFATASTPECLDSYGDWPLPIAGH